MPTLEPSMNPVTAQTDNDLMQYVACGEIQHLQVLFRRYHRVLNGFFENHGCDHSTSQDLTQETFLRILKFRRSFKSKHPFKAWMFQIARNVRIDHFRKKTELINIEIANLTSDSHESDQINTQEKAEDIEHLQSAIQRLKPEQREILYLARYEQLNYSEISKITGYSISNVKVRVFRALEKLKEHFYQLSETVTR